MGDWGYNTIIIGSYGIQPTSAPNECLHGKQRVIQDQFGRWTKSLANLETKQTAAKYRNVGKRVLDMRMLCFWEITVKLLNTFNVTLKSEIKFQNTQTGIETRIGHNILHDMSDWLQVHRKG